MMGITENILLMLASGGDESHATETVIHSYGEPFLFGIVAVGIVAIFIGMILSLYRMLRGPHLADRVLSGDVLSMHVVALVILLAIWFRTTIFFDAVLVIAIIGFASSLAFAQYIGARGTDSK